MTESAGPTGFHRPGPTLRLRPQILRRLGWHYVRVHSFDLYSDPAGVAQRIAAMLGVPPETPRVEADTQPIDVTD